MGALDVAIRVTGLIEARQALGALVQVAETIDEAGDWWVGTVVQYSCLPGRTRVTTEDGYEHISAIEPGDRVLTQAGVYKPVKRVFRNEFPQGTPMVRLSCRWRDGGTHDLELTANHRVMVRRDGRNKWVPAGEVRETDRVYKRRKRGWLRGTAEVSTCDHCGVEYTASEIDEYETSQGDRFCSPACRGAHWEKNPEENPHVGATRSDAARRRMAGAARSRLAENPDQHPSRIVAQRGHTTSCEDQVASFLDRMGLQYEREVAVGSRVVDFLVPEQRRVVEADGAFWHQDQARDVDRDRDLLAELPDGWTIVHVHFYSERFTPDLDPHPVPGSRYVAVNPGPGTFVDPDTFEATELLEVEKYRWTRSHKRAPKTRPLYDLEVEGVPSYHANGFLVHNSYLEYGTARMRAHPYFRPALRRAAAKLGGAEIHEVAPGGVAGLGRQEVVPGREEFTARFSGAPSGAKLGGTVPGSVSPATRANKLGSFEMSPAKRNPPVKRMVAALEGVSPRAFAFLLEREVKQMIRRKGLIDTGNLRASFVAAPTLPRMKAESLQKIDLAAGGTRREDIVNLEA